ncbi:hypothetical protein IGI04_025978 [Brassica rapa subsp. trilocularis]|uniref:Uncharacterized protein n=1 Tax=Brassica rapa subsp. trilocularis TaxID=1813537 RepID=A0ABQ7KVE6_BRACM|nr:hypothetical protein IGI04_025978 [Brassica rapa subsp. trilocularis]
MIELEKRVQRSAYESINEESSKKENVTEKTLDQITDVWQGIQLLGSDSVAAMELLRRNMIDLASVVPIGVLMILHVTPVCHAAILATIQRYVPGLPLIQRNGAKCKDVESMRKTTFIYDSRLRVNTLMQRQQI